MTGTITKRLGIVSKAHPRLFSVLVLVLSLLAQVGVVAAGGGGTVG